MCLAGLQTDENNVHLSPDQLDEQVATLQLSCTRVPVRSIWLGTVYPCDAHCISVPFDPGVELEMNNSLIFGNTGTYGKRRGFGIKECNCFQYCSSFGLPSLAAPILPILRNSVTLPLVMPGHLFQNVSDFICTAYLGEELGESIDFSSLGLSLPVSSIQVLRAKLNVLTL